MESKNSRIMAFDALRGLIMVLMALDHANHFVAQAHPPGEHWGGYFPVYQDVLAFITRLVTHLSAPGFFFLMGVGMVLFTHSRREGGWTEWQISGHFVLRGLVLIFLQFTIVNQAWKLGPERFPEIYVGVLFALGCTMILASLTLRLKPWHWLFIAGVLFLGTELLHPDPSLWGLNDAWGLLALYSGGTWGLWSNYPFLPWLELVFLGMVVGSWWRNDARKAGKQIFWLGVIFLLAFFVIRRGNGFGNIRPKAGESWIDFFNVVKYPPSMTFSLLTMGANLLLLAGINAVPESASRILKPWVVFGRVPLFFYVTHLYLYLVIGMWFTPGGTSIPEMYPFWILGLVILYLLCLVFGWLKRRHPSNFLLRYL